MELPAGEIVRAVRRHMGCPHYRVFLFGSRAAGKATPRSDIAVGLDAGGPIPLDILARIEEDLDGIPVLQKIDLVDFARVPDAFALHADSAVQTLYEQ